MSTRPITPVEWATDVLFTNPPAAGTATKVDPLAGKRAEGFLPTERPPAQHLNHVLNTIAKAAGFLIDAQWLNYSVINIQDHTPTISGGTFDVLDWSPDGGGAGVPRMVAVVDAITDAPAYSRDGRQWTGVSFSTTVGGPQGPRCLFYSTVAGLWIYCGGGTGVSAIETSPTGETWTARVDPDAASNRMCLTEDPGGLIVMCRQSAAGFLTSPDGITWTARANPAATNNINAVRWSAEQGQFVAVGQDAALTSPDGITWTDRSAGVTSAPGALRDVAYDPVQDVWCAVGGVGAIVTSSDGITWTDQSAGIPATLGNPLFKSVESNGAGSFLAVGGSGELLHSVDGGVTWRGVQPELQASVEGAKYLNSQWVLFGQCPAGLGTYPGVCLGLRTAGFAL